MIGPLIDIETGDVVVGSDGVGINCNGDIFVDIGGGAGFFAPKHIQKIQNNKPKK